MPEELKSLLEKRAKLVTDARAVLDRHKTAGKLPAEDQAHYDRIMQDAMTISAEVEQRSSFADREQKLAAAEAWGQGVAKRNLDPSAPAAEQRGASAGGERRPRARWEKRKADPRHLDLFEDYLHRRIGDHEYRQALPGLLPIEYRDLLADTVGSGHDLIPPVEFIDQILIPRDRRVWIRKLATVRRLLKSTDGYQPVVETNPDDADWTAEITAVNDDATGPNAAGGMTTGKRELKPNILTKLVRVSIKELMVLPQVANLVADRLGYKFGVTEEKGFMTGNGAGMPMGLFTAAAQYFGISTAQDVVAGTSASLTFDGLQAVKYGLQSVYWQDARWVMNQAVLQNIATLKDSLNRYLWQPNTQVGQPDMLLGFPVCLDVFAPATLAAGAYVAVLGDLSYYHIADLVEPFSVQRLNELYAGTNEVGFLGREYVDGMPVMGEAFSRAKLGSDSGS